MNTELQVGVALCVRGTAENFFNGRRHKLERGTLFLISPFVTTLEVTQSADFEVLKMVDTPDKLMHVMFPYIKQITEKAQQFFPILHLTDELFTHYKSLFEDIIQLENDLMHEKMAIMQQLRQQQLDLKKQLLLLDVLSSIIPHIEVETTHTITSREQIAMRFMQSLSTNYMSQRQVSAYAAEANLSQRYFSTIIREQLGMSPGEIISMVTINHAKRLLQQEDIRIKQVAEELGFPEQFTFRKYFKTYTGMSPKEYQSGKKL